MKKLFIIAAMLLSLSVSAQNVVRSGNVFKTTSTYSRAKADTIVTKYQYEDSKGNQYPIILNKANGHCYCWRISKKNGKAYKMWFTSENNIDISKSICKEFGITYVETKKKTTK